MTGNVFFCLLSDDMLNQSSSIHLKQRSRSRTTKYLHVRKGSLWDGVVLRCEGDDADRAVLADFHFAWLLIQSSSRYTATGAVG